MDHVVGGKEDATTDEQERSHVRQNSEYGDIYPNGCVFETWSEIYLLNRDT